MPVGVCFACIHLCVHVLVAASAGAHVRDAASMRET